MIQLKSADVDMLNDGNAATNSFGRCGKAPWERKP